MKAFLNKYPAAWAALGLIAGVVVVALVWLGSTALTSSPSSHSNALPTNTPVATDSPSATPPGPSGQPTSTTLACPVPTVTATSASALQRALDSASPGTVIRLAPGAYSGHFTTKSSGTASAPITLCGTSDSVLDGGGIKSGYVLHLNGASYWHLLGFTVQNGQKGVVTDKATGVLIQGLTVTGMGDEGIHLRDFSSNNSVIANTISHTGKLKIKFGEGIYVGSAQKNWCTYTGCQPDRSDHNLLADNVISYTTAESIDIKEGTTGGIIRGNSFNGVGMTSAKTWVNVKGNQWLIDGNSGVNSRVDGFETHEILSGWGTDNVFSNNKAEVSGPGYAFNLTPVLGNVVKCNNSATNAPRGLSNVSCSA